ncbi:DNA-directed RNA polymerase III subunit Rpc31-domain-containing protein [Dichotomopilus funicola]|uniref:DNA-directed RNA polymerase III subunit Rpc31-domain-containing protein n=1 Tax=Dichotomopilus funicola TaxID=1934379 RepID=A0AAN6ZM03_9PEZI|nr:DNA-directed RNA polymerase III subunit Rpc31-domain-containing protein [Dichotomopilus funicola]
MSGRGGRGGRGRGGRGPPTNGRRAVAQNSVPWAMDSDIVLDGKPSEQFPPYAVPRAPLLTKKEDKQISYFLLFREQCQDSPLYTQARSRATTSTPSSSSPSTTNPSGSAGSSRTYGQDQLNKRYGQTTKATIDPFTSVPMYSHRFRQVPRTLPDLGARSFAKEFFPAELHSTLDGEDDSGGGAGGGMGGGGQAAKRRRVGPKTLGLSSITSYKTAEELFLGGTGSGLDSTTGSGGDGHKGKNGLNKALELITTLEQRHQHGEDAYLSGEDDDDDWVKGRNGAGGAGGEEGLDDGDSNYEDEYESGDDYNAEAYFDGNQDDEEYDEGGDDGDYL